MSEKPLKFDNVIVNKKEFHASKIFVALNLADREKIVVSDKFKHSGKGFKYFVGYLDDIITSPCNIVPQLNGYIKYFDNDGKICLLKLKVLVCCWNIIKLGTKLKRH